MINTRGLIVVALVTLAWASYALAAGPPDAPDPTLTPMQAAERSAWFERQRMPDQPRVSCCGEADAYYADAAETVGDDVFAIITDTRPDGPLNRQHVAVGTRILIPPGKNKDTRADPNPTGHTIVFLGTNGSVYCYIPEGGV